MAVTLLAACVVPIPASAYFTSCVANITPTSGDLGSSFTFTITVNNTGGGSFDWIDITLPPGDDFTYGGNSISNGWTTDDRDDGTTITGGSIQAGQSEDFQIVALTGVMETSPKDWAVKVAPDSAGNNSFNCTGSLQTSLEGNLPQNSTNGVSAVTATNITQTSATITWNSDFPASSLVYYGLTSSYGQHSNHDTTNTTSHSVTLTGLTAKTTYHFQVVGSNGDGNVVYSIDNTFMTASNVTPSSGSGGGTTSKPSGGVKQPTVTVPGDTKPPAVSIETKFAKSHKVAPMITGTATDDRGIAAVEYSIDGGKNWLPVNQLDVSDKTKAKFNFTPITVQDGNYLIVARALDVGGNAALSGTQTLVIDKLPPLVGGAATSIGPQGTKPNDQGVMRALLGSDLQITLNAVGGPTSLVVDAVREGGNKKVVQSFSLAQSSMSGLWSGALNFQFAGTYKLSVRAVDGAGNKTERPFSMVVVDQPAAIIDAKTDKPIDGTVTVYYRDPETQTWVLWDAGSYDQVNPRKSTVDTGYGFYLPGGTYYFRVGAPGYVTAMTKSFTLREPAIVTSPVRLSHKPTLNLGPLHIQLPWFRIKQVAINLDTTSKDPSISSFTGKTVPNFSLKTTNGSTYSLDKLYGKPTIMSFVSTWSAPARDQLAILSQLDAGSLNVLPVGVGESSSRLTAYIKVAGYGVPAVIDDTNYLASQLGVSNLPTTMFIDRHGVVKKVVVGVLSKEELMKNVSSGL